MMTGPDRDELGLRMLCAWNNIPREAAPAEWSQHANAWTRDAWARVAEAAVAYHLEREAEANAKLTYEWKRVPPADDDQGGEFAAHFGHGDD